MPAPSNATGTRPASKHLTDAAKAGSSGRPRHARPRYADWILGTHPAQRLSIKVSLTGFGVYFACLLLLLYCDQVGLIDRRLAVPIALSLVLTMGGYYTALRSGWSRRFRDPSLTLPQMLTSITWDVVGYATTREAHGAMLMPIALTVTYGLFSLRGSAMRTVQVYTLIVAGLTIWIMTRLAPDIYHPAVELMAFATLGVVVGMLTSLARRLAGLRARERQQRTDLTEALARIEERAIRDALTGLYNRRHMNNLLAHHVDRLQRDGGRLSVALLDLDHFKKINDSYGHAVGDDLLQSFARTVLSDISGSDVLARWGGEEFLLLSPDTTPEQLGQRLDQLRARLAEQMATPKEPQLRVCFSAGIAAFEPTETVAAALERADRALYEAKDAGRNTHRFAHGGEPT